MVPRVLSGTYRGFWPIDTSSIGRGELEMVVGRRNITFRMATGQEIRLLQTQRSALEELTQVEVAALLEAQENDTDPALVTGYRLSDADVSLLFLDEVVREDELSAAIIVVGFDEERFSMLFGPAELYTPEQVRDGTFERALAEIEGPDSGVIPRLANGGKRI